MDFKLVSDFKPTGDQPKAIEEIVTQFQNQDPYVTLQGVTGSGKTLAFLLPGIVHINAQVSFFRLLVVFFVIFLSVSCIFLDVFNLICVCVGV